MAEVTETKLEDVTRFFETDSENDCVRFMGDELICYIPKRYENYQFLHIGEYIESLGIFKMVINGKYSCGLQLPAIITIKPVSTEWTTIDDEKFLVAYLDRGSQLLTTLNLLHNDKVYFSTWREFLSVGHLPLYVNYNNIAFLFDNLKETTGRDINIDHSVLEIIYSHLFRDMSDLNVFYRHTPMNKEPAHISLKTVSYGPSGTFAKIAGSYAQDGYNSALLNQADRNSELEDLWRR